MQLVFTISLSGVAKRSPNFLFAGKMVFLRRTSTGTQKQFYHFSLPEWRGQKKSKLCASTMVFLRMKFRDSKSER